MQVFGSFWFLSLEARRRLPWLPSSSGGGGGGGDSSSLHTERLGSTRINVHRLCSRAVFKMASGSSESAAVTLDSASDQLTGNIKAVPAMHIYNLSLGRGKLPSFILDIRSSEDFETLHLINSFNCHIESPFVTVEEIERIIKSSASLSQRLRTRENFVIAIVSFPAPMFANQR